MSTEQWRPVIGWERLYEVSDLGRVRSLDRISPSRGSVRRVKGRVLRPGTHPKGYQIVVLARDGQRHAATVHGLVAAAFLGPRPDGWHVCHNDGDPSNNTVTNLRYGTPTENNRDIVAMGRNRNSAKTHCPKGHEYTPDNTAVGRSGDRRCRTCHRERNRARRAAEYARRAPSRAA